MAAGIARWLQGAFNVEYDEAGAVVAGFAMFFQLFAGYFMLRPVRETMGIAGGVDNLQWLFTGTFVATLAAMPLFGWIAGRVRRRRILYWVYGFFVGNLLAFAACFIAMPGDPWIARAFYIWLSVFNMIAISVAWSVLVDVLTSAQSRHLFALMAAGDSRRGLGLPLLGVLLAGAAVAGWGVRRWGYARWRPGDVDLRREMRLGGRPLAGAADVLRSHCLLGIHPFVLLLARVATLLYFEQAALVEGRFPDP